MCSVTLTEICMWALQRIQNSGSDTTTKTVVPCLQSEMLNLKQFFSNNIENMVTVPITHITQKYDDTKINRKGEMYCATVKEAEVAGFRRAFRWRGTPTV